MRAGARFGRHTISILRRRPAPLALILLAAATLPSASSAQPRLATLSAAEVRRVLQQAAAGAQAAGLRATIAVTDARGTVLGVVRMTGARADSVVEGVRGQGLEGLALPSDAVAVSKAGSGALLSSGGNAFSTRTASFIVQDHFPPAIDNTPGGPLFGVQLSSLPCTDFKSPALPLGLSGDPGGLPLYKDGVVVGGVGVEGDGVYGIDPNPADSDQSAEERAALAGAVGFETPDGIRADRILADGIRLPFANEPFPGTAASVGGTDLVAPRDAPAPSFVAAAAGGVAGQADPRFPIRAGSLLTAADVRRIVEQAAQQSVVTRAAIRQPLGSSARVSISVVDTDGSVLGFFQNADAPNFGIDVSVQKARTANFFSHPQAGAELRAAGFAIYARDVPLDGSVAYTSRAIGFLAQPYFPPGIPGTTEGPFSTPIREWSPFNTGLHLDVVEDAVLGGVAGRCSARIARLPNGITIFPGGIPLYKDGRLAGAIGISGDGVDQDDLIAAAGTRGFEAPEGMRSDQLIVRGVRLPYVKFPRHPEL